MFSKNNNAVVVCRILLAAVIILLFRYCGIHDNLRQNQITFGNESRYIRWAVIRDDPEYDTADHHPSFYRRQILLFSQGMAHASDSAAGPGNMITLAVVCSHPSLEAGHYVLTTLANDTTPFTILHADVRLDFDHATSTGQKFSLTSAEMTVNLSGNVYTIEVNGQKDLQPCVVYFAGIMTQQVQP